MTQSLAPVLAGGALGVALALLTPWLDFHTVTISTGQEMAFHFRPNPEALVTHLALHCY